VLKSGKVKGAIPTRLVRLETVHVQVKKLVTYRELRGAREHRAVGLVTQLLRTLRGLFGMHSAVVVDEKLIANGERLTGGGSFSIESKWGIRT
jgi:hypothetical protein